jgi:uncharacterized membrane protein YhdT
LQESKDDDPMRWWLVLHKTFATPVVAPLMRGRRLAMVLGSVGAVQIAATMAGVGTFDCPIAAVIRAPCPGCGLSRACAALLRMDIERSVHWHAFALAFLAAIALFITAAILNEHYRQGLADWVERFERKTCLSTLLLSSLIVYWIVRLIYLHGSYGGLLTHSLTNL